MENWNDYIHKRFGNIEGLELSENGFAGIGLYLRSTDPEIETLIHFFSPHHEYLGQVMCIGKEPSRGINELAWHLSFTEENVGWLDRDLWSIITSGWKEEHYVFRGPEPYKMLPYVGGQRGTQYYNSCLFFILDLITFFLLSRIATKKIIHVEPMLKQTLDVPPLDL